MMLLQSIGFSILVIDVASCLFAEAESSWMRVGAILTIISFSLFGAGAIKMVMPDGTWKSPKSQGGK
jgi:hypothetical protein